MPYDKIITTVIFSTEKIVSQMKNDEKVELKDTVDKVTILIECGQIMQKELGEKKISRQ
jgi:hypothetical protein